MTCEEKASENRTMEKSNATAKQAESNDTKKESCAEGSSPASSQKARFNKRTILKLSILNCFTSVACVAVGIAAVVESKKLPHWVAKSAFGAWFGLLVFLTAASGIFAVMKSTSSSRAILFSTLNLSTLILSIMSLVFSSKAAAFYMNLITAKRFPGCSAEPITTAPPTNENNQCKETFKNKALLLTSLFSLLASVSSMELIISFLLLIFLRKSSKFCYGLCVSDDGLVGEQYSMYYAGCGAAPSFGSMTYHDDYVVEQKPISRPKHHQRQPCKKPLPAVQIPTNPKYNKCYKSQRSQAKPTFHTMESITEANEVNANEQNESMLNGEGKEHMDQYAAFHYV